jgi:hypothetical protein
LIASLIGALMPFVGHIGAHASATGGPDDHEDVVDRNAGCYVTRAPAPSSNAACIKDQTAAPGHAQLDITNWGFNADGSHFNASITTAANWPAQGALASALPGVQQIEARWVFASSVQNEQVTIGQTCSNKDQTTSLPAGDVRVQYAHARYCANLFEGPYPAEDGYRLFIGVTASLVNGAFEYDWEWGWSSELDQSFLFYPGKDSHDRSSSDKGIITVSGNTISLRTPYQFRNDLSDDGDPTTPEERTHTFARPGSTIRSVTAMTAGNVMVSAPDPAYCEADPNGYKALNTPVAPVGDTVGRTVAPVLQQNAPEPFNDPNDCWSVGQGVTFTADWAPGNPFSGNLGGYEPRSFPRSPSWAPGTGATSGGTSACTYPAGFTRLDPNSAAQIVDPVFDANFYYQYTDGMTVTKYGTGGASQSVPGVPGAVPRPPLYVGNQGLQRPKACNNVRVPTGYHFLNGTAPIAT